MGRHLPPWVQAEHSTHGCSVGLQQNGAAGFNFPVSFEGEQTPDLADLGSGKAARPKDGMGKAEPGSARGPRHPWVLRERLQGALHPQGRQPPSQSTPYPSHLQPRSLFLLYRYSTSKLMEAEQRERQKPQLLHASSPALTHIFPTGQRCWKAPGCWNHQRVCAGAGIWGSPVLAHSPALDLKHHDLKICHYSGANEQENPDLCYSRAQKKGPEGFLREAPSQPLQSPVPAPCHRGDAGRGCCQGRFPLVLPQSAKQPSPPALITATSSRQGDRPLIKTSWVPTCPALPGQSQQQSQLLSASCCRQSSCLQQRCPHRVPNSGTGQQPPAPSPSHVATSPRCSTRPVTEALWQAHQALQR